jgi:two-component system invasion response regulator UvrY
MLCGYLCVRTNENSYGMKQALQVLILEDHDIVAFALTAIAKDHLPDASVTTAGSFTKGISLMQDGLVADLVILDIFLPGGELANMVTALRHIQPDVRILVYTGNEEYSIALQFLNAGANGYLTKSHPMKEVGVAIKTILNGQRYIAEEMEPIVTGHFSRLINPDTLPENIELSPREREVMALLLDGKQTKQISEALNLKLTTVSAHKTRIFDKFQVRNVIELFRKMKF